MIPIGMGFYTIAYNTNLVTADEAPKQWKDLLDEKWNNVMAMADPQTSSAVYGFIWYIIEHQKYGWEYFDQLDALNITYIGSHGTIAEMVNIGERSVAVLTMANVIKCVNEGNPVGHNVPLDGSPTELVSGAICAGTPNQEAAELFMNYLVTVEGQELVNSYLGYIPVRNDMDFSFPDGSTLEGLDLYSRDVQWINENKEDIIDRFSVLFAN
jgi:iron(III) transport system substrate-binding protein